MNRNMIRAAVFATGLALAGSVYAQVTPFSVNAGDDGFTGWTVTQSGDNSGNFLGIPPNLSGNYWGLFAHSGETSALVYDFGGTLAVGQYVEITASIGWIGTTATVGFGLQNSDSVNRFESYYIGDHPVNAWKINDADGQRDITGPSATFADSSWHESGQLTFRFTQLAGDEYTFTVNGTPITNSDLNLNASDISQIRIFNGNAGSGSNHDQFFNNLSVIPEPSSILMVGLAGLATVVMLRRKRG
jgi:hypothetical protein